MKTLAFSIALLALVAGCTKLCMIPGAASLPYLGAACSPSPMASPAP